MGASGIGLNVTCTNRVVRAAFAAAALLLPAVAGAQAVAALAPLPSANLPVAPSSVASAPNVFDNRVLSLTAPGSATTLPPDPTGANSDSRPNYLDSAPPPAEEQPNIHGFFSSPFKTAYVTPRGLVVENQGLVWQPVIGLVFPIGDIGVFKNFTFVGGIWNSVNTNQADAHVGSWNEMDVFVSISATVANVITLAATYSPWNSPPHAFITEHTADLKISYNDGAMWGTSGFSLNPYVDLFWSIAGDSTVILGRRGGTGYVEPGIVPTYTVKAIPNYPITFTVPTYIQIGPPGYWDATGAFSNSSLGVVSTSLNATVPMSFIPARYGHWHADIGVTYDYLINNALLHAGEIASGNDNHNVIIGSAGFGVNF